MASSPQIQIKFARDSLLRRLNLFLAGVGIVAMAISSKPMLERGMRTQWVASMALVGAVAALAWWKRAVYGLRLGLLLGLLLAALLLEMQTNGFFRNAAPFAISIILLSEIFLGWKAMLASLGLLAATYMAFSWAFLTGHLVNPPLEVVMPIATERFVNVVITLMMASFLAYAARTLMGVLDKNLKEGDRLVADLEDQIVRRDIAESVLRQARDRAVESQKLEAVGQLSGGIAHDFNNLLAVIMASAASARERVAESDPVAVYLREIEAAAATGRDLNGKLLAFSRQQRLKPRLINPNDLLRDIAKIAGHLLDKRVVVHSRLAEGLGSMLVDEQQMQQVLLNLVLNARDALPDGGHLSLESFAAAQPPQGLSEGLYVGIRVADTGHGMDEPTRRRIFEPFYTTKEVGKGTGLGLSTALGIVQQSGGSIEVQSELGQGCTFVIYLPMSSSAAQPSEPEVRLSNSSAALMAEGVGVLIVDDNASLRRLNAAVLASRGYTVFEAGDGTKALELLRREEGRISLLIADAIMPSMNGSELVAKARKYWPQMKVLMISGYEKHEAQGDGARLDGFLQKPFSPNELIALIKDILG